jgi:hypothetical protein
MKFVLNPGAVPGKAIKTCRNCACCPHSYAVSAGFVVVSSGRR